MVCVVDRKTRAPGFRGCGAPDEAGETEAVSGLRSQEVAHFAQYLLDLVALKEN
jgi:hypothetical protein